MLAVEEQKRLEVSRHDDDEEEVDAKVALLL